MVTTLILAIALSRGPIYPQQWACVKECIQHPISADAVDTWPQIAPYDKLARRPNFEIGVKFTFGKRR